MSEQQLLGCFFVPMQWQYPIQSIHLLVTRLQLETITILSYAELFETSSVSSDTVSNLFALTYLSSHNPAAWALLFRAEYRASSLAILYGLSRRNNLLDSVASCLENDRDFVAFHETSVYLVLYGYFFLTKIWSLLQAWCYLKKIFEGWLFKWYTVLFG